MNRLFILWLIGGCSLWMNPLLAQDLAEIKSVKSAKKFIQSNPSLEGEMIAFTSGDTTSLAKQLIKNEVGFIFSDELYTYKIIAVEITPLFRASYVYLDGSKLSKYKIEQQRKEVLEKYKAGTPFRELALQYSMDGNAKKGGDLGWFKEKMMASGFEKAVKEHKAGEIFTVDLPENDWYYVVLKTHPDQQFKTIQVLKIKKVS